VKSILVLLHCESNTGYAINPLEATFFRMAQDLCGGDTSRIHFGYPSMQRGVTPTLPADFKQYALIDSMSTDPAHCLEAQKYIERHGIDTIFGFDQPVSRYIYKYFRRGGVKYFTSYWGAPMSSIFGLAKRTLKRLEVALRRNGPDHYIFESYGMADTAVLGRGIPRKKTSVVYLGVDATRFQPDPSQKDYVYREFAVPPSRKIFMYSGHMEERKGVAVIMRAANRIAAAGNRDDWQVLLFGNQPGEADRFIAMLSPAAQNHVKFAGYRPDLPAIQRGCHAAIIASTGWDSFPRSGVEAQASGLPLLVSDLAGLREAVVPEKTGMRFPVGDDAGLARLMLKLLDDTALRDEMSRAARARVESDFTIEAQLKNLTRLVGRFSGVSA
jgi:glycosyltransferase involved in cell wall biosynthesis